MPVLSIFNMFPRRRLQFSQCLKLTFSLHFSHCSLFLFSGVLKSDLVVLLGAIVLYCFEPLLELRALFFRERQRGAFSGIGSKIGWGSVKLPFFVLQHVESSSQPYCLVTCTWCSLVTFLEHSENHKINGLIRVE